MQIHAPQAETRRACERIQNLQEVVQGSTERIQSLELERNIQLQLQTKKEIFFSGSPMIGYEEKASNSLMVQGEQFTCLIILFCCPKMSL